MMNPRKAECVGYYLYGAGYFARDENSLAIIHGKKQMNFCTGCRKREECENEHEKLVRANQPAACEVFDVRMRQALRRGMGATLAAMYLGKQGLDPFAIIAVDNFKRGHADRGAKDGALIR